MGYGLLHPRQEPAWQISLAMKIFIVGKWANVDHAIMIIRVLVLGVLSVLVQGLANAPESPTLQQHLNLLSRVHIRILSSRSVF